MAVANYDLNLSGAWLFHRGDFNRLPSLKGPKYHSTSKAGGALKHLDGFSDENEWQAINLPHDWLTEMPVDSTADATSGCKRRDVAWYKTKFSLPESLIESAELVFDGVLGQTTVFVNGVTAMRNFSGYNRFSCEVGDYLLPDAENEIAIFADARRHEGWWYEGAGLYRPVRIRFRKPLRIIKDDCFIRTVGDTVEAEVKITGSGSVTATLTDKDGCTVATDKKDGDSLLRFNLNVPSAKRWSPENPNLYTCSFTLCDKEEKADCVSFSVGFRDIAWAKDKGMYLDSKPYRIKGICCHQDHAGLGAGVCSDVEEYRILRLKTLGANAYRCAHHAPTESLLDICDRLGMLVMVENRHFNVSEDTFKQLDALVKLSRNHPCVFLYSMFNEEPWQAEQRGYRIAFRLRERVRTLDATRAVTAAQNGGMLTGTNAAHALDVIGMNYNLDAYEKCHLQNPEKLILGTENSPTFATRAVPKTDRAAQIFADDSSEYPADFSQPLSETMTAVENHSFVAGCFVWSGFDHRGEPNPFEYPSVASHWGYMDSCGFDKNIAHWLRAYYLEEPYLHFAEYADAGKAEKILAFTNAKSGELFINGKSMGVKQAETRRLMWDVRDRSGEWKIVAQKDGKEISATYSAPLEKATLCVTDVNPRGKDGSVRILNICVVDKNGNPVLSENGNLTVKGDILGVGNGNPNAHFDDRANVFPLFNGMAQVITTREGEVTLSYPDLVPVCIKD